MTPSASPLVSVVVPVRNGAWCIERALRSLFAQTLRDIEIVCVDDASTDDTPAILSRLAAVDPRLRVVRFDDNRGTAFARKTGVLRSTGRYILFLDADDEFLPDACRRISAAISRKKVDILQFGAQVLNEGNLPPATIRHFRRLLAFRLGTLRDRNDILRRLVRHFPRYHWVIWNKIYDAPFLRQTLALMEDGKFTISEDVYISFLFFSRASSVSSIRAPLYLYRVGRGSIRPGDLPLDDYAQKCTRADCCHAMRRHLDAEAARLLPSPHDPDTPLTPEQLHDVLTAKLLRHLCSSLVVDRMLLTLDQIPRTGGDAEALPFFETFCRAWGPADLDVFVRTLRYGYARTRTPGFRLYSLLTAPLGIASFLWRKLRAPKTPAPDNKQDTDESAP